MVCQVEGLDGVIEGRGTVIGGASGVGQGMGVNGGNWAILILDIGHKFYSAKLVGLRGLSAATSRGALLLERKGRCL